MTSDASLDTVGPYGARRPRPGLTPERIVEAGRRLIARDGLDALTMRAVAAELGTAAGSLYRHVEDRDELLQLILEQVAAPLVIEVPGHTPAERLRNRWIAFHDYMTDHVWVLHVLIAGSRIARNALPFTDACLADFCAAGLDGRGAGYAFRTCYQLTLGELLDSHPLSTPERPSPRDAIVAGADASIVPTFVALRDSDGMLGTSEDYARSIGLLIEALLPT